MPILSDHKICLSIDEQEFSALKGLLGIMRNYAFARQAFPSIANLSPSAERSAEELVCDIAGVLAEDFFNTTPRENKFGLLVGRDAEAKCAVRKMLSDDEAAPLAEYLNLLRSNSWLAEFFDEVIHFWKSYDGQFSPFDLAERISEAVHTWETDRYVALRTIKADPKYFRESGVVTLIAPPAEEKTTAQAPTMAGLVQAIEEHTKDTPDQLTYDLMGRLAKLARVPAPTPEERNDLLTKAAIAMKTTAELFTKHINRHLPPKAAAAATKRPKRGKTRKPAKSAAAA